MKNISLVFAVALLAASSVAPHSASAQEWMPSSPHTLAAVGDHFELDGSRFQIISGAIHYARVPRAYWRDRLKKARAMGLNTVETYVFWNFHETSPGVYDFSGQHDIAEFIREAQQEGLWVILRPGPYVCAEWDFGGYPAWLLHEPGMVVRSSNPAFIAAATRWLHRLGQELAPLQSGNGGPILAVQVENEYGSYGSDHAYMEQIHHILIDSGFTKSMLYTADGADELPNGSLLELPAVINFGTGEAKTEFAKLDKIRPNAPKMCGEYWDGWFDHYGDKHHTADRTEEAAELKWMLEQGYSVNLYMFHGGTSFGWMNGANSNGENYEPDTTSYDYDAPLSEGGAITPKYILFRDVIREVTGVTPPGPPAQRPVVTYPPIILSNAASLWDSLPAPIQSDHILSMEDVGQSYGYILYRTQLPHADSGELRIEDLHDYAQVYLDGELAGALDRRRNQFTLTIKIPHDNTRLDILVENTGRVNFGRQIVNERAGITHQVLLVTHHGELKITPLTGWSIYPLPMQDFSSIAFKPGPCRSPCFYRETIQVKEPADTWLDVRQLDKGEVFVNGQPLGRVWYAGPQGALYLPAAWLHSGANDLVVFDFKNQSGRRLLFSLNPIETVPVK